MRKRRKIKGKPPVNPSPLPLEDTLGFMKDINL